jgi:hypothetical protein
MFENVAESSFVHLLRRVARDRDPANLHRVLKLMVAALLRYLNTSRSPRSDSAHRELSCKQLNPGGDYSANRG